MIFPNPVSVGQVIINTVQVDQPPKLVLTRFPYTYAYDYLRQNWGRTGLEEFHDRPYTPSRAEMSGVVKNWCARVGENRLDAVVTLAKAACAGQNITVPPLCEECQMPMKLEGMKILHMCTNSTEHEFGDF